MMAEHKKKSVGRDALIPPGRNLAIVANVASNP